MQHVLYEVLTDMGNALGTLWAGLIKRGGVTVAGSETDASTRLGLALCSLVQSTGMHYHNQV